jgi:hypothetical protein
MMWTEDVARELVADRFRTLRAAYSPEARPAAAPRRSRRRRRAQGRKISWRAAHPVHG